MTDKRLFFGVSQSQIDEAEKTAREAEKAAREVEKAARDAEEIETERKKREQVYAKYIGFRPENIKREKISLKDVAFRLGTFFGIWAFVAAWGIFANENAGKESREDKTHNLKVSQRLRDAFWPVSNGWYVENIGDEYDPEALYRYDASKKGKFLPRGVWYVNMAFVLIGAILIARKANKVRKENKTIREENAANKYYNETGRKAVDMMLALKEFGEKYEFSEADVKKIMDVIPSVISKMSKDERVYFDMLMDDKIDIKNDKTFMDMAVAIMAGHLESHPEAAQLILDTFEEKSLPNSLLSKCIQLRQQSH